MDITFWTTKTNELNGPYEILYLLSNDIIKKNIEKNEYIFITNFIKKNKIVNAKLFSNIIKKLNDINITTNCITHFNEFYDLNFNINIDHIIKNFSTLIPDFTPTPGQLDAIIKIINFLTNHTEKIFGLFGLAGTGKTYTLMSFVYFILHQRYIKKIAITAPTNKAVDVCKSKFKEYINDLYNYYVMNNKPNNNAIINNKTFQQILDELKDNGIHIEFLTIHKILDYKTDVNKFGNKIFVKGKKSLLFNFDLIIIDECSMISLQITANIIDELHKIQSNDLNVYPKIIFSGDAKQLPTVNEKESSIFIKLPTDINEKLYLKFFPYDGLENAKNKIKLITDSIINMDRIELDKIVRNNNININKLCYEIRKWIDNEIVRPNIKKYIDNKNIFIYEMDNNNKNKINTKWFNTYLNDNSKPNIILTWTNNQCDLYNNSARQKIYNSINIKKYEINDVLILNDFYNLGLKDKSCVFYTSEQIIVRGVEYINKDITLFDLTNDVTNNKYVNIYLLYRKTISLLNDIINTNGFPLWKLTVIKNSNSNLNNKDNIKNTEYIILTLHELAIPIYEQNKKKSMDIINNFKKLIEKKDDEQFCCIMDTKFIIPLWRQFNTIYIDKYANVNYGYSITTHKSQGSTYFNVYIDVDDILSNNNIDEAKRCLYTALTRASNNIHILI